MPGHMIETVPTVLVVDDTPQISSMVASVLKMEGFSVLTANNATDAIRLASNHPGGIDLLLSDVMMPGMDGPALARELRSSKPDLPVILMSGACQNSEMKAGGPVQFIEKPFSLAKLIGMVHILTGRLAPV